MAMFLVVVVVVPGSDPTLFIDCKSKIAILIDSKVNEKNSVLRLVDGSLALRSNQYLHHSFFERLREVQNVHRTEGKCRSVGPGLIYRGQINRNGSRGLE